MSDDTTTQSQHDDHVIHDDHHDIAVQVMHEEGVLHEKHLDEEGHLNLEANHIFDVASKIIDIINEEREHYVLDLSNTLQDHHEMVHHTGKRELAKRWLGRIVRKHKEQEASAEAQESKTLAN